MMMMGLFGYGVTKMAWSHTKGKFGVCGNFRFAFINLTDIKATRSIVKPEGFNSIKFVASTNTSDNADVLLAKKVSWTGTADSNTANELVDSSETFDPRLSGLQVSNTADTASSSVTLMSYVDYKDADELYCSTGASDVMGTEVYDAFPDGNETYTIYNERAIQCMAVTAGDEGTLLLIGD